MSFGIDTNINALASRLKTKPAKIRKGIGDGLDASAKQVVNEEKAHLGPHSKSGRTLRSIKWVKTGEYSRSAGPFTNSKVPFYLEKGRGPIFAKLKGMPLNHSVSTLGIHIGASSLKFTINGKTLFRKSVGPADPRPFVAPTRKSMQTLYPKIMAKHVGDALKS
jgi:hypothetical protein